MKNIVKTFLLATVLAVPHISLSQQINWRSFSDTERHIININTGWDYGLIAGLGYGYKLNLKLPIVLGIEYSSPFGKDLVDDFKTKIGGQAEVLKMKNFSVSVKAVGIFRRYQNDLARFANFGSEFSANFGYYKPRWYIAGEFGFDKAITTNIMNSEAMKTIYPHVKDGWYVPTGGNFFYGFVSGYSFKSNDLYLKIGKMITQDFKTTPTIPFYFQLGFSKKL
ncbi:MAG: hypothetical protein ACKVOQ_23560 [Cyclobacteriaceae bacterium]